jgi:hypothetical protein
MPFRSFATLVFLSFALLLVAIVAGAFPPAVEAMLILGYAASLAIASLVFGLLALRAHRRERQRATIEQNVRLASLGW